MTSHSAIDPLDSLFESARFALLYLLAALLAFPAMLLLSQHGVTSPALALGGWSLSAVLAAATVLAAFHDGRRSVSTLGAELLAPVRQALTAAHAHAGTDVDAAQASLEAARLKLDAACAVLGEDRQRRARSLLTARWLHVGTLFSLAASVAATAAVLAEQATG